jgi:hypothetical protein
MGGGAERRQRTRSIWARRYPSHRRRMRPAMFDDNQGRIRRPHSPRRCSRRYSRAELPRKGSSCFLHRWATWPLSISKGAARRRVNAPAPSDRLRGTHAVGDKTSAAWPTRRPVAAQRWSAACMTGHGPSVCGESIRVHAARNSHAGKTTALSHGVDAPHWNGGDKTHDDWPANMILG